jgi:hypothetical protein
MNKKIQSISKLIRNYALLTISIQLFSACASLPKYQAIEKDNFDNSILSGHYDTGSKVLYSVRHDSSNVYLALSTSDFGSQFKILNQGLTVYIDETGKKKNGKYWSYPVSNALNKRDVFSRSNTSSNFPFSQYDKSQKLYQSFQMNNQQLELVGFDGAETSRLLYYPLGKSPIEIGIAMDSTGLLNYTVIIPKTEIFTDNKYNDGIFSFGVKSGEIKTQMNASNRPSGDSIKQGNGGAGKSGGMGGRGGGKSGRAGYVGGNPDSGNKQGMVSPIDFWFQVALTGNGSVF